MGKRVAFTLAEVLITLGIIGVVAAMTMPTLIQNHKTKTTVVKLKKMHTVLSQAYTMYLKDNEPFDFEEMTFTPEGAEKIANAFKPYLKILKECGGNADGCMYNGLYKKKNGDNNSVNYATDDKYYKLLLNDGALIWFRGATDASPMINIMYDINGTKGPNQWGVDLFEFDIVGQKLFPTGVPNMITYSGLDYNFDNYCASDTIGFGCAAWVIYKENMDYLYCDDLTWNGKQKCK